MIGCFMWCDVSSRLVIGCFMWCDVSSRLVIGCFMWCDVSSRLVIGCFMWCDVSSRLVIGSNLLRMSNHTTEQSNPMKHHFWSFYCSLFKCKQVLTTDSARRIGHTYAKAAACPVGNQPSLTAMSLLTY